MRLSYDPPGGSIGATIAKLFGEEPSIQVDGDLRRFKQVLEVGEVVHSHASIHRGMHPPRRVRMKATCWEGKRNVRVKDVPDPKILNSRDAIVRVTSTAICGSDLHLYNGFVPTMEKGDILGHEFMGEVVEVGRAVKNLAVGDRVVVPFPIACGNCDMCQRDLFSLCENSNPNAWMASKLWGHSTAGIFGYSHLTGGYAGGQAEYARVPFADVGPLKVRTGSPTTRPSSSRTSSRPATWARRCATSGAATSSRCGARGPSVSSPSPAPGCWARNE